MRDLQRMVTPKVKSDGTNGKDFAGHMLYQLREGLQLNTHRTGSDYTTATKLSFVTREVVEAII